jgi:photosystem II stability/assembly factor-like uncharacterized protein
MKIVSNIIFLCTLTSCVMAQTPAEMRIRGEAKREVLEAKSWLKELPVVNIGPSIMSGRVTDIAVHPDNPSTFLVAYASGGLWKTVNNGQSFEPLFDNEAAMTIGAIAVDWKRNVIYIGTGEVNSSRSSYAGLGVYRSDDGGATWNYLGLPESHHIGTILLHPDNPDIAWVAVLGHLYTSNAERGVYKTQDGGKTWQHVLKKDANTGAVELSMDPNNPDRLYACLWERERKAWNFKESGPGSGIYTSVDGGKKWQLLTCPDSGFPSGEGMGRTGLAVAAGKKGLLYAVVDNQARKDKKEEQASKEGLRPEDLDGITKEAFLALDDSLLNQFLKENNVDTSYNAALLKAKVKDGTFRSTVLTDYLDLGAYVFDSPIYGCQVYKSSDYGATWTQVDAGGLFSVYNTYGYYFGKIYVSPQDTNKLIVLGVPIIMSEDGGKSWKSIGGDNVHADHHIVWMNPDNDDHLIIGNDGGVNITYDSGKHWFLANTPAVGQFYAVEVDDAQPYNVYGGLQDNGVWYGPSTYTAGSGWLQRGEYPYKFIYGGDGMQVEVDKRDNATIYTGYQFGYYARMRKNSDDYLEIRPRHEMGEFPLRFNWQTPIQLSEHNQDILYYGSNRLHRSMLQGAAMETLSDDLTNGRKEGDVPFGTISTISESPIRFGLIYVGTDDGNIQLSTDGGYTWQKRTEGLPAGLWVSRVVASAHEAGRVYITLNGYRNDDFEAYIYRSDDFGKKWYRMGQELPHEPVNVIIEDPVNPRLLFVGTDNGLYASFNGGDNWMAVTGNEEQPLPRVAVHDLAIQPRVKELVIATHGRSLYKMEIGLLEAINDDILAMPVYAFTVSDIPYYEGQGSTPWWRAFASPDVRDYPFYWIAAGEGESQLAIMDAEGKVLHKTTVDGVSGINVWNYDLSVQEALLENAPELEKAANGVAYLAPGSYTWKITSAEGDSQTVDFKVVKR